MSVLTLVLAGGPGRGLSILSAARAKPAQPFGGKYRLIDFVLSNVANSGLSRVALLAQFHTLSLTQHVGNGEPWDLARALPDGVQFWLPSPGRGAGTWYRGTADALYQNRELIAESGSDRVLVLAGDHVSQQDYRPLLAFHEERGADLTVGAMAVPPEAVQRFGMMDVESSGRVVAFAEKPDHTQSTWGSLGIYVFNTEFLLRHLDGTAHDFGRDLIPVMVVRDRVFAYRLNGYWADIGTLHAYWATNLALLDEPQALALNDAGWPVRTRAAQRPAARLWAGSTIDDALVCDGCVVRGTVIHSILSPGVVVEAGAVVRDSVIMHDTVIGAGAVVARCVVDEGVRVGRGAQVGAGEDGTPNELEPEILNTDLTVVGRRARIPVDAVIGRNCRIDPGTDERDYGMPVVASGATVERGQDR